RGLLMDQTSENDFIVKSYISKEINELLPEQKEKIYKWFEKEVDKNIEEVTKTIKGYVERKPSTIEKYLKLP
ncbi:TPA: hypothetical protein U0W45_002862, partial [Listeria monocytogenes]|nr:hypothetical protein [Listeria monocytogenes]